MRDSIRHFLVPLMVFEVGWHCRYIFLSTDMFRQRGVPAQIQIWLKFCKEGFKRRQNVHIRFGFIRQLYHNGCRYAMRVSFSAIILGGLSISSSYIRDGFTIIVGM